MPREVYSHCRLCPSSCGMVFQVEDNRIVSHGPNRQSLVSEGYMCIKGDMSVELLNGSEPRLTESLKRTASGAFEPIASDRLMDEVADQIARTIAAHGPASVALYIGTAAYRKSFNVSMARQFMAAIGSPSNFSTMTIDQSAHWVVDGRMGTFATGRPFLEDVDVMVVAGGNPLVSHSSPSFQAVPVSNTLPKLRAFRARGGKLIVVDPRKSETAKLADLHLQVRPGVDTEVFACLLRSILASGSYDKAFCDRYVTNLAALRDAVAPYTPELVAKRAGVAPQDLEDAARLIGGAKRLSAGFGTGTSMSPNANTAAHMIEALNAICGGFARAGDIVRNPGVFVRRPTVERVSPPNRTWETGPKLSSGHGLIYGEFPTSRLADEILTPGPTQIRTLIVFGANPVMAFGEPERLRQALNDLDCLVVLDARMTETAELADYVVAPPLLYEVHEFNMTNSARTLRPIVQYTEPVVDPPPGVLEEWKFFNGIANRLGATLRLAAGALGFDARRAADKAAIRPDENWTTLKLIEETFAAAGLSVETAREHPNGMLVEAPPTVISGPSSDDGARLDVCPPDVAAELGIILEEDPDEQTVRLISRRIVETMNTEFRVGSATFRRYDGAAPLFMHPDDLARHGFGAGEMVVVRGRHGEMRAMTRPDRSLRPGVVAMPHCWSGDPESQPTANTAWLVSMRPEHTQTIDGMPQQSSIAVTLHKAEAVQGAEVMLEASSVTGGR